MKRLSLTIMLVLVFAATNFAQAKPWPEIDPDFYTSDTQGREWSPETIKGADPIPIQMIPTAPADRSDYGKRLSLTDMVDIAIRNSPTMRKAWETARASAVQWGISKSEYYPFLDGQVIGAFGELKQIEGGKSYGEVSLSLSYLLLDFGGRKARIDTAKQALIAANWTHNQTIQDILRDVPQAYYYHVSARARKYAAQQSLRDANVTLASTRTRHEAGVATIADVLQAKASREQAVVDLESAKGATEITKGQLATTVGWPANTNFEAKDKLAKLPLKSIVRNIDTLIDVARENRPELNVAMANVRKKEAELRQAKTLPFPKLSGAGKVMWRGTRTMHENIYYGGLQLELPIFHGFKMQNSIRRARRELDVARSSFRQTDENVIQDTWSAYYNFKTSGQQLRTSRALLASASESYKVSLERYKVGAADIVELLNTQAMLAHARAQLVDSRMMLYTSYAELLHAIGMVLPYSTIHPTGS